MPHNEPPWYERNIVWGPIGLGGGILLAVVAAMKADLRWLFWFAGPLLILGMWGAAKHTRYVWWITGVFAFVVAGALWGLSAWLRPPSPNPSRLSSPSATAPASLAPLEFSEKHPDKIEPPKIKYVYIPVKSAPPAAAVTAAQPTTVNNAANGIAISGGIVANPTVNNYAPPPGILSSFVEEIDSRPNVYRAKIHIKVTNTWHDAAFVVKCDRPCHGEGMPTRLPNQYLAGNNWDDIGNPNWTVVRIELPNPLPDGTEFTWWISSKDGNPIQVTTIQRADIVAQQVPR